MAKDSSKKEKVSAEVDEETPDLVTTPEQPNAEAALQHPSLADGEGLSAKPDVEVAERSQDVHEPASEVHRKDFVVLKSQWGDDAPVDVERKHRDNLEATRQYLMHQGMRPTGDGSFVGQEDHPDGKSLTLTYEVPVVPSVIAEANEVVHAHVLLDDQHAYEKRLKDDDSSS